MMRNRPCSFMNIVTPQKLHRNTHTETRLEHTGLDTKSSICLFLVSLCVDGPAFIHVETPPYATDTQTQTKTQTREEERPNLYLCEALVTSCCCVVVRDRPCSSINVVTPSRSTYATASSLIVPHICQSKKDRQYCFRCRDIVTQSYRTHATASNLALPYTYRIQQIWSKRLKHA